MQMPDGPMPALESEIPEGGVAVPMLRQLHLPALEVMINDQGPFKFGFDTGASGYISFNQDVADQLGLEQTDTVTASDGTGQNMREVSVYGTDTIKIGSAVFHGADGHIGSYNRGPLAQDPIDGIIGIGLFTGLTLTMDYLNEELRISQEPLSEPNGKDILALDPKAPVPSLQMQFGNESVLTHIDSRNMGWLIAPASVQEHLNLIGEPVQIGMARTQFNEIPIEACQVDGNVSIGAVAIERPWITFAEIFRSANIGSRLLEQFEMTYDMANHRVRFHRDDDGPIEIPKPQPRAARRPGG
jgi:hypothetical protein